MSNVAKYSILSFVGVFLLMVILVVGSFVSAYNYGNRMDNMVKAQYLQSENVLAQYSQRIQELVQVPTMYKDDLKEVVSATMQGRYGRDGSKAVFSFIKEHSQGFDSSLYKNISQNIEAGRKNFEYENEKLIDLEAEYKISIGTLYTGFWLRLAGFPRISFEDYKPIFNNYAIDTFKEGKEDGPIKLR